MSSSSYIFFLKWILIPFTIFYSKYAFTSQGYVEECGQYLSPAVEECGQYLSPATTPIEERSSGTP